MASRLRAQFVIAVLLLACATGVVLRLAVFLQRRSLWMDESMLALNIALYPLSELSRPPVFEQVAPPLFLWIERLSVVVLGVSELSLRFLPLIAGCLLAPAVWFAGRRLIGPRGALVAAWAAALGPELIHFSAELKPYAVDATVTAVLIGLAAELIHRDYSRRAWWILLVGGSAALLLSTASVFGIGAIGLALLAHTLLVRRTIDWRRVGRVAALGGAWLAVFIVVFAVAYRSAELRTYMARFWRASYLTTQPDGLIGALQYIKTGLLFPFLLSYQRLSVWIFIGAIPLAALVLWRRGAWRAVLLVSPLVLVLVASALRIYPFRGRLVLFLAPVLCLSLGTAAAWLTGRVHRSVRLYATLAVGAFILLRTALQGMWYSHKSAPYEEPRVAIANLLERAKPDEAVYLYGRSVPNWLMYTTNWSSPDTARVFRLVRAASALGPNAGNAPSRNAFVQNEGDALRFPFRASVELLGVPSGIENMDHGAVRWQPDPGWAANEMRRIVREAHPRVWIFCSHFREQAMLDLVAQFRAAGARLIYAQMLTQEAVLYFDLSPAAPKSGFAWIPAGTPRPTWTADRVSQVDATARPPDTTQPRRQSSQRLMRRLFLVPSQARPTKPTQWSDRSTSR
jgi:hypothetical protein